MTRHTGAAYEIVIELLVVMAFLGLVAGVLLNPVARRGAPSPNDCPECRALHYKYHVH